MLRDKLIRKQIDLELTDEQFARLLKVPRPTWNAIKIGRRDLHEGLVRAAMRTFPEECMGDGMKWLVEGPGGGNGSASGRPAEKVEAL